uniref:Uncharacterized protein n=1 Tax=Timema poppense TaxID=170557 RepID=A0A7R9H270_TIMPO|nr:unnamed protein product [Timema poppensis]
MSKTLMASRHCSLRRAHQTDTCHTNTKLTDLLWDSLVGRSFYITSLVVFYSAFCGLISCQADSNSTIVDTGVSSSANVTPATSMSLMVLAQEFPLSPGRDLTIPLRKKKKKKTKKKTKKKRGFGTSVTPSRVNDVISDPLYKKIGDIGKSVVERLNQLPELVTLQSHIVNVLSHPSNSVRCVWGLLSPICPYHNSTTRAVSSEGSANLVSGNLGMSFTYRLKSTGPTKEPYGPPSRMLLTWKVAFPKDVEKLRWNSTLGHVD